MFSDAWFKRCIENVHINWKSLKFGAYVCLFVYKYDKQMLRTMHRFIPDTMDARVSLKIIKI